MARIVAGNEGMRPQSSAVVLLHLRRLHRFLKRQGLHSTAHTLESESLVHLDAAHLQKLVKDGQWDAAWCYLRRFSPLWEGDGTSQHLAAFLRSLEHHAMLDFLACRGEEGGRAATSIFWSDDDDFRSKFPEIAQQHDLYRSMASAKARASVNWEDIKLKTLEKLQELLHLHHGIDCSLRMRKLQHIPTPSEITPLGLRGSWRHPRKRVDRKSARELSLFLLQKQKRLPSTQETNHSGSSGVSSATLLQQNKAKKTFDISSPAANIGRRGLRCQDDYCTKNAQEAFDPADCFKRPRTDGDVGEQPTEKVEAVVVF